VVNHCEFRVERGAHLPEALDVRVRPAQRAAHRGYRQVRDAERLPLLGRARPALGVAFGCAQVDVDAERIRVAASLADEVAQRLERGGPAAVEWA